ncbi:ABC transporter ATP-binding protein [Falsiroseomonas selenitidurans]|uniref:ABC transporter ATP-binding protein n=1 Tax=Falsiroseomonas selenitidurans TaxID=2716335 RepID=A0ABX1E0U6_9PROT|nr:ABC transporter ATP-binding protein [Falsiroseomonas selenitidurans]NKC30782.1 ABC transporter ATP-binding protein [Falsiroseomonas selenitidurans]
MTDTTPHLVLDRLTKRYGSQAAVDGVALSVVRGECIALLGPSGCGKTTTLRLVAGFILPDEGHILLNGTAIEHAPPHRRQIGMVFQNYALFPHLTAAGNVAFGLEMRDVGRAERDRRVAEALAMVGLAHLADRYPARMSGGQQQRIALARALVIRPELLLLDEPLSNLDAGLRVEMREEIARLRQAAGITTLFVTHDQEEALALADRVAVMDCGRIVECAAPAALTERPRHLFTAGFLGARSVLPGRAEAGAFHTEGGFALPLPPAAPDRPSHLVLRAARLLLLPAGAGPAGALALPVVVEAATRLDDSIHYEVSAGPHRIRVHRPSAEPAFAPGAAVTLAAPPEAIAWIEDFSTATGAEP